MIAHWPTVDATMRNPDIESQFARFQAVLAALREVRSRQNIAPKTPIEFSVRADKQTESLLAPMAPYFAAMAGATATAWGSDVPTPALSANFTAAGCEVFVDLAGHIDVKAEITRNQRESEQLQGQIAAKEKKLANEDFVRRAPAEVVAKERASLAELRERLAAVLAALARLTGR